MKTFNSVPAVLAVVLLLTAAPALRAGPSPDQQNRMRPAVTKPAPTLPATACNPAGQACSNCQHCAGCSAPAAKKANS